MILLKKKMPTWH